MVNVELQGLIEHIRYCGLPDQYGGGSDDTLVTAADRMSQLVEALEIIASGLYDKIEYGSSGYYSADELSEIAKEALEN